MDNKHGITPRQIKQIFDGETKTKPISVLKSGVKKLEKPKKAERVIQSHDNADLANVSFSTTSSAILYPTPDWFGPVIKADATIIIPLWRTDAKNFIESINLRDSGLKIELLFVDDCCPVDSKLMVLKNWENKKQPNIKIGSIWYNTEKQGWSACCNLGASKASADIIVFMSPESKPSEGWLRPLIRLIRQDSVGAISCLRLSEKDLIENAGYEWFWSENNFLTIGKECYNAKKLLSSFDLQNTPEDLLMPRKVEAISAKHMAISKKKFLELGGFHPSLRNSLWAGFDISCTLKEKGFDLMVQPDSPIILESKINDDFDQDRSWFMNRWLSSNRIEKLVKDKKPISTEPKNILIRRRAAHGDVLVAASLAAALKKKYPSSSISFNTLCPEIIKDNPWIDKFVDTISERQFNLFIDLDMAYEQRPEANMLTAYADAAGVDEKDCRHFIATEEINDLPEDYVVVHSGKTLWVGRNWSTVKFDSISKKLREYGKKIVVVGGKEDHKPAICDLDLRGKTTIQQLATVIKKASFFVGIDSLPMQIAQVFDKKGVVFFGSIKPETRLFAKNLKPVSAKNLKCIGCHHRQPTPCIATVSCEIGVQDCVLNVTVDNFWEEILKLES